MMFRFNLVSNQVACCATGDEQPRAEIQLAFYTEVLHKQMSFPITPPSFAAFSSLLLFLAHRPPCLPRLHPRQLP